MTQCAPIYHRRVSITVTSAPRLGCDTSILEVGFGERIFGFTHRMVALAVLNPKLTVYPSIGRWISGAGGRQVHGGAGHAFCSIGRPTGVGPVNRTQVNACNDTTKPLIIECLGLLPTTLITGRTPPNSEPCFRSPGAKLFLDGVEGPISGIYKHSSAHASGSAKLEHRAGCASRL